MAGALSWNPRGGGTQLELLSLRLPGQISVRTMGRGHWTGIFLCKDAWSDICQDHAAGALDWIFLHKGAWSDICQYHGAGALDWNFPPQRCPVRYMSGPRGGGTQLEFSSVKVPGQISVSTTGRGRWTGTFLRKGARSDICQDHGAGVLDWNFLP